MKILKLCLDLHRLKQVVPKPSCILFFSLVLFVFGSVGFLYSDDITRNNNLSNAYIENAQKLAGLSYIDNAISMLDMALSFKPNSSDALYLKALYGFSRSEPLAITGQQLEQAIAANNFRLYKMQDANALYAAVLMYTKQPTNSLRYLYDMPQDSQTLYIRVMAMLALNKDEEAAFTVLQSLQRYPNDTKSILAWLLYKNRPANIVYNNNTYTQLLNKAFSMLNLLKEINPAILPALAPYASTLDNARFMVREYRAMGHASPAATVLALRYGLIYEEKAISEMFSGLYPITYGALKDLFMLLADDEARGVFLSAFSNYTGNIIYDSTNDGYAEAVLSMVNGQIEAYIVDDDQNGIFELKAEFIAGIPSTINITLGHFDAPNLPETNIKLYYKEWPSVSQIDYYEKESLGGAKRQYLFAPGVLPLAMLEFLQLGDTATSANAGPYLPQPSSEVVPTEEAASALAYIVRKVDADIVTTELYLGQEVMSWKNAEWGHAQYAKYINGMPIYEEVDMDGDGRYETRLVYVKNNEGMMSLAYTESDFDFNGIYEFRQTADGTKSWDYDQDGAADVIYYKKSDGTEAYSYVGNAKK